MKLLEEGIRTLTRDLDACGLGGGSVPYIQKLLEIVDQRQGRRVLRWPPPAHYFFRRLRRRLSARWNSLATFCEMPAFLAKDLEWAAAAIKRRCFLDLLGISESHNVRAQLRAASGD